MSIDPAKVITITNYRTMIVKLENIFLLYALGSHTAEFRHGDECFTATIEDRRWIESMAHSDRPLKKGDAFKVLIGVTTNYTADHDRHSEEYAVLHVLEAYKGV